MDLEEYTNLHTEIQQQITSKLNEIAHHIEVDINTTQTDRELTTSLLRLQSKVYDCMSEVNLALYFIEREIRYQQLNGLMEDLEEDSND